MTAMDKINKARVDLRARLVQMGTWGRAALVGALVLLVAVPFGIIRGCKPGSAPPAVTAPKKAAPKAVPVKRSPGSKATQTRRGATPSKPRSTVQREPTYRSPARGTPSIPEWRM